MHSSEGSLGGSLGSGGGGESDGWSSDGSSEVGSALVGTGVVGALLDRFVGGIGGRLGDLVPSLSGLGGARRLRLLADDRTFVVRRRGAVG